ncbi:NAD(P)-binding protein [Penicillium taxi]|uniref:NAD(P)-binding protein n=1 Tax=Penicillium taxi TaxID=168475 RepID=UPI00254578B5|nr:NAD(P)-binding protein [Penicillium taxi]KAJ5901808.1 NAD(P)-binding protein [Penicillium taxi]
MSDLLWQSFWIPTPTLTENNLPDQTGKVHIVTGGYTGVGLELVKILYSKNATVYIAGRSPNKAARSISLIKDLFSSSKGRVIFLEVDFSDFSSIKPAVKEFLSSEDRLDVLTNNAGVMRPPAGSTDSHGHELQMGTNCLGPFLFTKLLIPLLVKTAKTAPSESVRVTWASSLTAAMMAPNGGVQFESNGIVNQFFDNKNKAYGQSKAANCLIAAEFAARYGKDGIISVSWNPGNLHSELQRHSTTLLEKIVNYMLLYPTKYGAYTELYAGWSQDITSSQNGAYVAPWGRLFKQRKDITEGMKRKSEGGTGHGEAFWEYCEKETEKYE